METQPPIDRMQTPRLELRAITVSSDECAVECVESGMQFRGTDPENFAPYEAADAEYNDDEQMLAVLTQPPGGEYQSIQTL